jgi:purine-nucleoside phosphorylase
VSYYEQLETARDAIREQIADPPLVGVVLGSGLGRFADVVHEAIVLPYRTLPHWPVTRVAGHDGRLIVGTVRSKRVAVLAGRSHLYEGHDAGAVTFAVRVLGLLGVRTIVLTNAAGAINATFSPGGLMVIDDHINLTGHNPLAGTDQARLGPAFLDMSAAYAPRLRALADESARAVGVSVAHGVYAAVLGPSYETPAEIRYLRSIGADAIGMSTVPEAIAARQLGLDVLGISCLTNLAAGLAPAELDHSHVLATAERASRQCIPLLEAIVEQL